MTDTAKFTLRTDAELLKKFRYIADYNARSANRELEVLIKRHIAEFEKEHGKITFNWNFSWHIVKVEQLPTPPLSAVYYLL